jgi:hypothetical protein
LGEVAQKIGAKKNACRMRAWRYKRRGIPLRDHPPPPVEEPDPHYWDKLADYARSLLPPRDKAPSDAAAEIPPAPA